MIFSYAPTNRNVCGGALFGVTYTRASLPAARIRATSAFAFSTSSRAWPTDTLTPVAFCHAYGGEFPAVRRRPMLAAAAQHTTTRNPRTRVAERSHASTS